MIRPMIDRAISLSAIARTLTLLAAFPGFSTPLVLPLNPVSPRRRLSHLGFRSASPYEYCSAYLRQRICADALGCLDTEHGDGPHGRSKCHGSGRLITRRCRASFALRGALAPDNFDGKVFSRGAPLNNEYDEILARQRKASASAQRSRHPSPLEDETGAANDTNSIQSGKDQVGGGADDEVRTAMSLPKAQTLNPLVVERNHAGGNLVTDGLVAGASALEASLKNDRVEYAEILAMEREVFAATQARLDMKRVTNAILLDEGGDLTDTPSEAQVSEPPTQWSIALASGAAAAVILFVLVHSFVASAVVFVVVTYLGSGDPVEEEGEAGALARVLGRLTLRSIQKTEPKIRAVARAAVTGDAELQMLRSRVAELEAENEELRRWIEQRQTVDVGLSSFSMDQLKGIARNNGIPFSGKTKAQLMLVLLDKGLLVGV